MTNEYKLTAISFPSYTLAVEFVNANSGKWTWIKQSDELEQAYDLFPCGNGVWSVVFAKTITAFQKIAESVLENLNPDKYEKIPNIPYLDDWFMMGDSYNSAETYQYQFEGVQEILNLQGYQLKKGKERSDMRSYKVLKNGKAWGSLYLHQGEWTIDGKLLDDYGDQDAWQTTLNDSGILSPLPEEQKNPSSLRYMTAEEILQAETKPKYIYCNDGYELKFVSIEPCGEKSVTMTFEDVWGSTKKMNSKKYRKTACFACGG